MTPILNKSVAADLAKMLVGIDSLPAEQCRKALKVLASNIVERAPRTREGAMLGEVEIALMNSEAY
jgi:hypothetical protein